MEEKLSVNLYDWLRHYMATDNNIHNKIKEKILFAFPEI